MIFPLRRNVSTGVPPPRSVRFGNPSGEDGSRLFIVSQYSTHKYVGAKEARNSGKSPKQPPFCPAAPIPNRLACGRGWTRQLQLQLQSLLPFFPGQKVAQSNLKLTPLDPPVGRILFPPQPLPDPRVFLPDWRSSIRLRFDKTLSAVPWGSGSEASSPVLRTLDANRQEVLHHARVTRLVV